MREVWIWRGIAAAACVWWALVRLGHEGGRTGEGGLRAEPVAVVAPPRPGPDRARVLRALPARSAPERRDTGEPPAPRDASADPLLRALDRAAAFADERGLGPDERRVLYAVVREVWEILDEELRDTLGDETAGAYHGWRSSAPQFAWPDP